MVECGLAMSGSSASRRGLQPVRSRRAQILAASSAGTWFGLVRGRDGRSSKQASVRRSSSLARRQRVTHSQQVDLATFEAAAAASNVYPRASTSRTIRSLPFGVSGALACCIRASEKVVSFEHPQPLGRPGPTYPLFATSLGRTASAKGLNANRGTIAAGLAHIVRASKITNDHTAR